MPGSGNSIPDVSARFLTNGGGSGGGGGGGGGTPQGGGFGGNTTEPSATTLWTADFVNALYTLNGASAAVTDLFQQDINYGTWNPATGIVASEGVVAQGPVTTTGAFTPMADGFTLVANLIYNSGSGYLAEFDVTDSFAVWTQSYAQTINTTGFTATITDSIGNASGSDGSFNGSEELTVALTIRANHIALSINGGAATAIDKAGGTWTATMGVLGIDCSHIQLRNVKALSWRSDAELPALSAPSTHAYWRIAPGSTQNGVAVVCAELHFYDKNNNDLRTTVGGTASAQNAAASHGASLAVDGNASTYWQAADANQNEWLSFHFNSPVDVTKFSWQAGPSTGDGAPSNQIWVQYSDDGITWVNKWQTGLAAAWTAGSIQTFTRPV